MSNHTQINLLEVKDSAPDFGMGEFGEARFARQALGAERIGMAYYKINPSQRLAFGHTHSEIEETYLVISGGGRFRVDDEIMEIGPMDVIYAPPGTMRGWEAGPDGGVVDRLS